MKDSSRIIMTIKNMEDIKKLKASPNIKYLNLDIYNPNLEVIYYLIDHGEKYSYSEIIGNIKGYIYVPHDIFKQSQLFILDIINSIPIDLNEIEIARYLYITIGKNIGYDINSIPEKNETFNLKNMNMINNIWGSISSTKGTNTSLTKLYLYLCRIMNLECQLTDTTKSGYLKNILTINNRNLMVDITKDIPFIQANFPTKYFSGYNDNIKLDRKISYIKDNYSLNNIEYALQNLDYTSKDIFQIILQTTQQLINASKMKPIELGIIYDIIFTQYCPNFNISINNLYIYDTNKNKEHFIIINHNDKFYSFNYIKNSFVEISKEELQKNMEENKIGIYLNEDVPYLTKKEKTI